MTDFDNIIGIKAIKEGDLELSNFTLFDKNTNEFIGYGMSAEGNNDKSHGQKGHRKIYLTYIFDNDGKIIDIEAYVPSIGEIFSFF